MINSSPGYAARIILILKEINKIKNFFIGNDYIFDKDGKFIDGVEAVNYNTISLKENIIRNFITEQHQLYYLHTTNPFHC
jgi:hypothetical protein